MTDYKISLVIASGAKQAQGFQFRRVLLQHNPRRDNRYFIVIKCNRIFRLRRAAILVRV